MGARFVRASGLRFAYLVEGPTTVGPDPAPLALCLHGFPDHAHTWRHLLPVLADLGYRAVAPWLRGYAPTEVPAPGDVEWPGGLYGIDTLTADVNALHRALRGDHRAVLVGHDWGAVMAYRAGYAAPERWRRLITLAVPPERALAGIWTDAAQLRRSAYLVGFQLPGAVRRLARGDLAQVDHLWRTWSPGYTRQPLDREPLEATLRSPGTLAAALGYYRAQRRAVLRGEVVGVHSPMPPQPTLYLHGADDGCIHPRYADAARPLLRTPGSGVEVLPDAGHFLHLEQPDVVADRVRAFLTPRGHRPPRPPAS